MEVEHGIIKKITDKKITIELTQNDHCNTCAAKGSCHFIEGSTKKQVEINRLPSMENIEIGNSIKITFTPKARILSTFLVFILPILFLITGYFTGLLIFQREGYAIISAICALVLSFVLLKLFNKIFSRNNFFLPQLIK